ncbi:hypothetical protein F4809DRAFT_600138 [Biscogniauxia mediterranea]|nr:hypothetical protein F4809DRAFT_600138 [Biscogniauxia mediterranea]
MDPNRQYQEQPGLEVQPEPEPPQVVGGPVIEKKYDPLAAPREAYEAPQVYSPPPPSTQPGWDASQGGAYANGPPSDARADGKILGLRKKSFFLIFGPLLALLIIGLAVGLGVGLGLRNQGSSSTSNSTPILCPAANGTTYTPAGGDSTFDIICSIDYNSANGTVEDIHEDTATAEDCIDACNARSTCVGAGWGNYQGAQVCWMKRSLGTPQNATENWVFVIKQ